MATRTSRLKSNLVRQVVASGVMEVVVVGGTRLNEQPDWQLKTSPQSDRTRQKVDVKHGGEKKLLLHPLIIPLSHTQSFHEESTLCTVWLWLKCSVNKQIQALRDRLAISFPLCYQTGLSVGVFSCHHFAHYLPYGACGNRDRAAASEGGVFSRDIVCTYMREEAENRVGGVAVGKAACATFSHEIIQAHS